MSKLQVRMRGWVSLVLNHKLEDRPPAPNPLTPTPTLILTLSLATPRQDPHPIATYPLPRS